MKTYTNSVRLSVDSFNQTFEKRRTMEIVQKMRNVKQVPFKSVEFKTSKLQNIREIYTDDNIKQIILQK